MYIIGITPGAYTVARGGGSEAAREFAGIVEKISFGYTVGCNFFQIDQETFGEFIEPEMLRKLSYLVEKMNVEWALHGLIFGADVYQSLEHINYVEWKRTHLILNKDLVMIYYILKQIEKNKYSPRVFPHYTVYHASAELLVGYAQVGSLSALREVITATPFGKMTWKDFLEERKELKRWFVESGLAELLMYRELPRTRGIEERIQEKEKVEKAIRVINFFTDGNYEDNKKSVWNSLQQNEIEELFGLPIKRIKEDIFGLDPQSNLTFEIIKQKLQDLKDMLNKPIDEFWEKYFPIFRGYSSVFENLYNNEKDKKILKNKGLEKEVYEKYFDEIKSYNEKTIDIVFKSWEEISKLTRVAGGILYEDAAMVLVAKYVELLADGKMQPKENDIPIEVCKFLRERYLTKPKIREGETILGELATLEEHVEHIYEKLYEGQKKPLIDLERLIINLTPQINAMVSIVYWVGHFLVGIEDFPEIIDTVRSLGRYEDSNLLQQMLDFAKKKPIEKLKIINEEAKRIGINRDPPFFISIETPEGSPPHEGLRRLCNLVDVFITSEALNLLYKKYSDGIGFYACIDTEHLLSNAFDPEKEIKNLIEYKNKVDKVYSRVAVYHIGIPKPYHGTTHLPFEIGSDEQFLIYKYCYLLKEVGFSQEYNSYLIFERGGGRLPFEFLKTVLIALRLIKKYLEMDVRPEDLLKNIEYAKDFFGISEQEIREREIIFQKALEPLRGLIVWPEEAHTLFGKEAIEKYRKRPEEWAAEELK